MSPRSAEFLEEARARLLGARTLLQSDGPVSLVVSAAYYAMLYAARAALSEEDRYSKTHSGTWQLFRETFVVSGPFDEELYRKAHRTQEVRENVDYDAKALTRDQAEVVLREAERFVGAVAEMIDE